MKNIILTICLFAFIVCGCKKEDTDTPTNEENTETAVKLLSKITSTGKNNSIRVFDYDKSNNLISIDYLDNKTGLSIVKSNLTYKDNKLSTMDYCYNIFYYELTHSVDSICLIRKSRNDSKVSLDYIFYPNANGVIDSVNMKYQNLQYRLLLDSNNNFMGYSPHPPVLEYEANIKYDNMKNPYATFPDEYCIVNSLNNGKNNVKYYETSSDDVFLYYKYDIESYPIECVIQYISWGSLETDTLRYEYK